MSDTNRARDLAELSDGSIGRYVSTASECTWHIRFVGGARGSGAATLALLVARNAWLTDDDIASLAALASGGRDNG